MGRPGLVEFKVEHGRLAVPENVGTGRHYLKVLGDQWRPVLKQRGLDLRAGLRGTPDFVAESQAAEGELAAVVRLDNDRQFDLSDGLAGGRKHHLETVVPGAISNWLS